MSDPRTNGTQAAETPDLYAMFEEFMAFQARLLGLRTATDRDEILDRLCEVAGSALDVRYHKLLEWDRERGDYTAVRVGGSDAAGEGEDSWVRMWADRDIVDWAMEADTISMLPVEDADLTSHGIRTQVLMPMQGAQGPIGILLAWVGEAEEDLTRLKLQQFETLAREGSFALENHRLATEMQELGDLLDNVIESVPHAVIAVDRSDHILACNLNAEFMFGFRRAEAEREDFRRVLGEDLGGKLNGLMMEALEGREQVDYELEHELNDDVTLNLGISTSVLLDKRNRPQGVVFIMRDMSLSREVQKLRDLDRMKSEFVHTVSHELKTPLTSILGGTEILMADADDLDDDIVEVVEIIQDGAKRLHALITDLLDLSRLESGRIELEEDLFDLRETADDVTRRFRAGDREVVVEADEDREHLVLADRDKIVRVLENLVSNAVKYSPDGGTVTVTVGGDERHAEFAVSDEGIGIPEDKIPSLFEKFYRVDSSTTAEIEGTGLGLSIVKHIVEMHGGEITVESVPDEGSTFRVLLPRRTEGRTGTA